MDKRGVSATFLIRPDTSDRKAIEEVWDRGTYEKPRLGFRIEPGERWLDAGANIGAFSALVLARGGSVRAVEAEPVNAEFVRRNAPCAEVIQAALTLAGGTVLLHTNTNPLALRRHSVCKARRNSSPVETAGISWDAAIKNCTAAKLNIEGAEIDLLSSSPPLGELEKLVFEWSFDVCDKIDRLRGVVSWLSEHFTRVHVSRRLVGDLWRWYPPNCFVWAWERIRVIEDLHAAVEGSIEA